MNTFWERNCDDSPNADDHNFDSPTNHKFVEVEGNPEKKRICVGNASCKQNGMQVGAIRLCIGFFVNNSRNGSN